MKGKVSSHLFHGNEVKAATKLARKIISGINGEKEAKKYLVVYGIAFSMLVQYCAINMRLSDDDIADLFRALSKETIRKKHEVRGIIKRKKKKLMRLVEALDDEGLEGHEHEEGNDEADEVEDKTILKPAGERKVH